MQLAQPLGRGRQLAGELAGKRLAPGPARRRRSSASDCTRTLAWATDSPCSAASSRSSWRCSRPTRARSSSQAICPGSPAAFAALRPAAQWLVPGRDLGGEEVAQVGAERGQEPFEHPQRRVAVAFLPAADGFRSDPGGAGQRIAGEAALLAQRFEGAAQTFEGPIGRKRCWAHERHAAALSCPNSLSNPSIRPSRFSEALIPAAVRLETAVVSAEPAAKLGDRNPAWRREARRNGRDWGKEGDRRQAAQVLVMRL